MTPQAQTAPLVMSPAAWLASSTGPDRPVIEREWPGQPGGIQMLPCGVLWDAIRLPEESGLAALHMLLATDAAPAIGPVMHDPGRGYVYWLVPVESHADLTWARITRSSRVFSTGDYLGAPEPDPAVPGPVRWVRWPDVTGVLTPPSLLAAAVLQVLPTA
ncbi:hypothetical protein E6W39_24085 [Kitasatospora acidiphila]|uniref:DNA primase/polymerase bifunctional N-terminal domain-containing protein n=1 Tax=Kitasatospora acidiphila TaxID=2567942 RepID=A0A540W6Z4_9ACTN|nr:hypothetical protein [Kitasatospora acidiphila]TQF04737.1 hypothetical protein E6W39_24085 [Kitasatospora acidiphila]